MRVGRGIDQLGGNAELAAGTSNAAFEHITHAELSADLLRVDWFVLALPQSNTLKKIAIKL